MSDPDNRGKDKGKKNKPKRERVPTPDASSQASSTSSNEDHIGSRLRSKKLKLHNNNNTEDSSQPQSSTSTTKPKAATKESKKKVNNKKPSGSASSTTTTNDNSQEKESKIPNTSQIQEKENIESSQASSAAKMSQESQEYNDKDENLSQEDTFDLESALESEVKITDDFPFEVLSIDDLVQLMIKSINEVNAIVEIHPTKLRILLNHFKWDKEKLLDAFYDEDQEKLFKDANISINLPNTGTSMKKSTTEDCNICFVECQTSMMYGLGCPHRFCKDCWKEYLTTKIMEEGVGQTISCPAYKCPIYVDDQSVMDIVSPDVKHKYQKLITNSFVQCNKLVTWCPGPGCSKAIKAKSFERKPVTCHCGLTFCFSCSLERHDAVSCQLLEKWLKKCADDSETMHWLAVNTKDCPKCHTTIEKNGGCNHMSCKNNSCNHQFCWICHKPWENHQACNKYEESPTSKLDVETKRAALERYVFYSSRYVNHINSSKNEEKLFGNIEVKMSELVRDQNMSWIETQFLKDAVDTLVLCRRTLMYTYAFAFYLKKNNQSAIFEDNQADLEKATDELSGYLERDLNKFVESMKTKVQDLYRYCEGRRKVLLEHIDEGYEHDWWKTIDLN